MLAIERKGMEWVVKGVTHWLDRSGVVPTLLHRDPSTSELRRGWFARPETDAFRLFKKKLLRHGIEVYYG